MFDDPPSRVRALRRPPTQLVADTIVVIAITAVVVGFCRSVQIGGMLPQPVSGQVLTFAAAAVSAAAAIIGAITAHLLDDSRPRWIAAALALYALVVLPSSAIDQLAVAAASTEGSRLVGYLEVILLLLCAVRPPERITARGTWTLAAIGLACSFLVLFRSPVIPGILRTPLATTIILAGWTAVATAVVVEGYRRNSTVRWRVGLGLVVLSSAQLYRMLGGDSAVFAALRLLGLAVVVCGFGQLLSRTLANLNDERFAQQEALSNAAVHMDRAAEIAAERDHELRNGLAGLAGITHLLSAESVDDDQRRLRHAVLAELGRLHQLVDGTCADDEIPSPAAYSVEPVVAGLVALRRPTGADIVVNAQPHVAAIGSSSVLAQVVINLLANCDRHAPGARIVVLIYAERDEAVIDVRDEGPGPPIDADLAALFGRGVRDETAGGHGFGLRISRDLVEREGGTLTLHRAADPPGCIARVRVPRMADVPTPRTAGR